jgi:hypothetical protein
LAITNEEYLGERMPRALASTMRATICAADMSLPPEDSWAIASSAKSNGAKHNAKRQAIEKFPKPNALRIYESRRS